MARILVVDDSALERTLVVSLLSDGGGHEVYHAKDGEQALLSMAHSPPDVVVTD